MNTELPTIGERIAIIIVANRQSPMAATVTAMSEPDANGRISYTVDLDGYGPLHGECHQHSTPFRTLTTTKP